ncbi:MAG: ATPase [Bacteroidota bacterium]|nr:ATPase [Bacteroidota bacterium]
MYVLIADSGSTKTDWVLLDKGKVIKQVQTIGFNPYFQTKDQISLEITNNLRPHLTEYLNHISELYYYGAGCSTFENCSLLENTLTVTLNIPKISVAHDLLAAARALCNKEWGIACILGTGSNSCLYNGKHILENVPSVGYLWGDHGSGAQIGKFFINDYFKDNLPNELKKAFQKEGYNREEILNSTYKTTMPSRYLASISLFVGQYQKHPFIQELLYVCFDTFFKQQVNKYTDARNYKVSTVGSIGFIYKDIVARVAEDNGYQMGNVIKSPIEGLIQYHS